MSAELDKATMQVLYRCRSVELAMSGLYETLADLHHRQPTMARLWRKTAREEANHASQFSLLIEAMTATVEGVEPDLHALENLRDAIEMTAEEFRLRSPSVREALVAVIDFEEAMDRIHAHQAVRFRDLRGRRMFEAMMAADSGHITRLRTALRGLGG
jgi:rubrerythrin